MKVVKVLNKEETYVALGEEWKSLQFKLYTLSEGESVVVNDLSQLELVKMRGRLAYYQLTTGKKFSLMQSEENGKYWIVRRLASKN
jgi:acyl-ACP thioesterase